MSTKATSDLERCEAEQRDADARRLTAKPDEKWLADLCYLDWEVEKTMIRSEQGSLTQF